MPPGELIPLQVFKTVVEPFCELRIKMFFGASDVRLKAKVCRRLRATGRTLLLNLNSASGGDPERVTSR